MRLLRSALFNVCFYVVIVILMLAALPALARGGDAIESHARRWARWTIALLDHICGVKVEFRGLENLPAGPAVVAAKHQSTLDVLVLLLAVRRFTFIYKRELDFLPLFGAYLRGCRQISIDRSKRAGVLSQIVTAAKAKFAENRRLIIFPEGTRRPVGAPPVYKGGVARIVEATGVICVPAALNSGLFWPRHRFIRPPGKMVVEFLPPISSGLDKDNFMRVLQAQIETATDRLVAEAVDTDASLAPAATEAGLSRS
ncbi:MAG: lysophospholipid acyltransferase family protein [Methylovirgula sp.]|uniref:lysophospholipid acyltransferase family protein n=1 Tax=Methylovirgula sp. TaxID=1978224 RepID=UPI003075FAFD